MVEISLEDIMGLGLSQRTAYQYARYLHKVLVLLDSERGVDLETCSGGDLAAVLEHFSASNSSRAILRASVKAGWEIIGRDNGPLRAIRVPPRPRRRCRALGEDTAQTLEQLAYERRHTEAGLAVLIGLYSALRRAEISRARWDDVLRDDHGRPEWIRVFGKGGVEADVPLHPVLIQVFLEVGRATGWIFPSRGTRSKPVTPQTVWYWVRELSREAGLVDVKTHRLRHTALAECNDRSGDLRGVQQIARHSRPEETAGYTRTQAKRLLEIVSMIDYGRGAA